MSRRRERYRPNYSGLAYAGGGSIANIGAGMIGGGLAQDEKNLAQDARNRAFKLEESKERKKDFNLIADKQNVAFELQKKESKEEAEKKSNINATRKYLEGLKIDTKGMSDDDIFYNGQRLENIYKDETSRKIGKTYHTGDALLTVAHDENNEPITKVHWQKTEKLTPADEKFRAWNEDKIQVPADRVSEWGADVQTYDDKGKGYWVSKEAYAKREKARKALNDKL